MELAIGGTREFDPWTRHPSRHFIYLSADGSPELYCSTERPELRPPQAMHPPCPSREAALAEAKKRIDYLFGD